MSDVKISGLPSSTGVTPASDYIPIVHNGTTEKITPDQLIGGSGFVTTTQLNAGLAPKADTVTVNSQLSLKADLAALAATTGAGLVGFQQTGTGSVATTVDAKLKESVSVLDFDADPTGVANSSTAFTNAMSAAKVVIVPAGIYKLDTTVTRPNTCILEVDPTTTFTGVGELLNSGVALGDTIPEKTIFGKMTIRDSDYTVAYPNGFVNDPNMGQILRLDGKTEPGQCGVFLSGDEREPVLGPDAYVGFHTRHNNSINTPQVWGFNPVVVKSYSDATAGAPTIIVDVV